MIGEWPLTPIELANTLSPLPVLVQSEMTETTMGICINERMANGAFSEQYVDHTTKYKVFPNVAPVANSVVMEVSQEYPSSKSNSIFIANLFCGRNDSTNFARKIFVQKSGKT
jgi:hypothetical protein